MEWPFVISSEQWSAFGAMLGGIGQLGLVAGGVLAGREWRRQKRVEGLHALVTECLLLIHDMEVATDRGRAAVNIIGEAEQQFTVIEERYVQIMGIATRCRYYDDALADSIQKYALHVRDLLRAKSLKRDISEAFREGVESEEEKQTLRDERRKVMKMLFRTEDDPWYDGFVQNREEIVRLARLVSWGRHI